MKYIDLKKALITIGVSVVWLCGNAQSLISEKRTAGSFAIVANNATNIYVDENDHVVVKKIAQLFQQDVAAVSGKLPEIIHQLSPTKNIIIVGTLGTSTIVDDLIKQKKLIVDSVTDKWEGYIMQVVDKSCKGYRQGTCNCR